MAVNGNPWALGSDTHDANALRGLPAALVGLPVASHANGVSVDTARLGSYGVVNDDDFLVAGTGGLNYSVAAGRIVVAGTSSSSQGAYVGYNTSGYTATLAAHSAFIRHDLICYRVRDTDVDATGSEDDSITVVQGIAASTDPAVPASLGSLVVLARATVPATSGTPTFTDLRPFVSALGGTVRCTSAARPTSVARRKGMAIWEVDTLREVLWDGSSWVIKSEPPQTWNVTSVTQSVTVSCTTSFGRFRRSRGHFTADLTLAITGTGTAGHSIVIPAPMTLSDTSAIGGSFNLLDAGNQFYAGSVYPNSTTDFVLMASENNNSVGTDPSFALANGDAIRLHIEGWY